jgi:hypothetical protein
VVFWAPQLHKWIKVATMRPEQALMHPAILPFNPALLFAAKQTSNPHTVSGTKLTSGSMIHYHLQPAGSIERCHECFFFLWALLQQNKWTKVTPAGPERALHTNNQQ